MSTEMGGVRVGWIPSTRPHTLDDMAEVTRADQTEGAGDGPLVDISSMSLSEVDTSEAMYGEVTFPLDLPEAEELRAFSMEHWLYLAAKGLAPAAPVELSPFPLPLHPAEAYERNLREWELIDGDGKPYPDLLDLMKKMTIDYEKAVWGTVRFPLRAHDREYEFDEESANWGLEAKQTIIPRVPFLITWSRGGEIVSATSTEEGMNVNRRPAQDNYLQDFAEEIQAVLNPAGEWEPRSVPTLRVTRAFAEELAADPTVGTLTAERGSKQWTEAIDQVATKHGVDRDTAIRLMELLSVEPAVIAEFIVTVHRSNGMESTPELTSGTLVFFSDETGGVVSVHSPYDNYGSRVVIYEPGTTEAVVKSLKAMFIDASNAT